MGCKAVTINADVGSGKAFGRLRFKSTGSQIDQIWIGIDLLAGDLTKRVNDSRDAVRMKSNKSGYGNRFRIDCLDEQEASLSNCDAILLSLSGGTFVVVRPDERRDLWPTDGGWEKVRELNVGDEVVYKGEIRSVRAVDVYRSVEIHG